VILIVLDVFKSMSIVSLLTENNQLSNSTQLYLQELTFEDFKQETYLMELMQTWSRKNNEDFLKNFFSMKNIKNPTEHPIIFAINQNSTNQLKGIEELEGIKGQSTLGFLTFVLQPWNSNSSYTSFIIANLILGDKISETYLSDLLSYKKFKILVQNSCKKWEFDLSNISSVFLKTPIDKYSKYIASSVAIPGNDPQILEYLETSNQNWFEYKKNWDICKEIQTDEGIQKQFLPTTYFLWKNPNFSSETIPKIIANKMNKALWIYDEYSKGNNPFKGEIKESFSKILDYQQYIQSNKSKIVKHLTKYKRRKNWNWIPLLFAKKPKQFRKTFEKRFSKNIELFRKMGFRIRVFKDDSEKGIQMKIKYQIPVLNMAIQCLPTLGSNFLSTVIDDDHLSINPDFFNINFVHKIFKGLTGYLEYEIEPNKFIFAGVVSGYVPKGAPYSRQFYVKLLLPKIFRGYGLGQITAFLGMLLLEMNDEYDYFVEDALIKNMGTHKVADFLGFQIYGVLPNLNYNIVAYDSGESKLTSHLLRKIRPCLNILRNELKEEKNPSKRENLYQMIKLQDNLVVKYKQLVDEGKASNITY
jgi:hypothetical protein